MLTAVIVDDEPLARQRLRRLLGKVAGTVIQVVAECTDVDELMRLAQRTQVDVLFLDIELPGGNGFTALRRWNGPPPRVVFVSAYDQHGVRAFEDRAVDYLLKPVRAARLAEAIAKARRLRPPADEILRQMAPATRSHFSICERGRILLVPVAEVLYLKAEQKYVVARSAEREYLLDESLVQLEDEFPERFLRIHRNCLIARHAVKGVARATTGEDGEAHWVVMLDGVPEQLPVSRRQWPAVKEALGV